uniref:Cell growth-regulating nucleolar protein n=1 Tax=Caligus rogercresseyi TaxID=217165 RepID=C1BQA7_CALRO|nr:Cell growth-regulating nucleolar protein [Caligus rogercresseyi]
MVFFTCSACGASLKKNQVEKHCNGKCRHCEYLTCIDCLKDFPGDSYKSHTKCMTENERYGGQNYVPKVNKNENKQLEWVQNIQSLLESSPSMDPDIRSLLETIIDHENIPRKRVKFINFMKNINRRVHPKTVEKTWEFFEKALKSKKKDNEEVKQKSEEKKKAKPKSNEKENKAKPPKEISEPSSGQKKKKDKKAAKDTEDKPGFIEQFKGTAFHDNVTSPSKKRKHVEEEENDPQEDSPPRKVGKFDWEGTISTLLEKKDGSLSLKGLKKKILSEYESQIGASHKTQEGLLSKMNKKITKNPRFKVKKDTVFLVT